jgi:Holliday junction resolvase RusA-like endonuclease
VHAHLPPESDWGDIDHYVSNVLDTMTGVVYTDDKWIERVVLTRTRDAEEPYCDVFVYAPVLGH